MDHRISKDMISSGMIPSGEKNQEDLSRTQYGTAPSPNALADVYKKMYEKKEETLNEHHKKDADGNTIPHEDEEINEAGPLAPLVPLLAKVGTILKGGAAAGKAAAGAAKITTSGGAIHSGGAAKLSTMQKVGKTVKSVAKNPMVQTQAMMSASSPKEKPNKTADVTAGADLFDIVKGQLLDEGLSEEEIKDIMLTLTPDEILKEIEESSMSAGSSGGHYSDGGDGVFRSKEQVGRQFNKNFPPAKNGKVDKSTRKAINTSARDFGIQGPTTLKQSVEPEGETI